MAWFFILLISLIASAHLSAANLEPGSLVHNEKPWKRVPPAHPTFTSDQFHEFLSEVDKQLNGQEVVVIVFGGICAVQIGARETTGDIDFIFHPETTKAVRDQFEQIIASVAEQKSLPEDWMNTPKRLPAGASEKTLAQNLRLWPDLQNIKVYIAEWRLLFAMKLSITSGWQKQIHFHRSKDASDGVYFLREFKGENIPIERTDLEELVQDVYADPILTVQDMIDFGTAPMNVWYQGAFGVSGFAQDCLPAQADAGGTAR